MEAVPEPLTVKVPVPFNPKLPDVCEYPVTPERAPALMIKPLMVLVAFLAVMVPLVSTEKLDPLMMVFPVARPNVNVPVPLAETDRSVFRVEAEIAGAVPEKVKAVEVRVSPLIVPVTRRLSSIFTSPPENSNWSAVL